MGLLLQNPVSKRFTVKNRKFYHKIIWINRLKFFALASRTRIKSTLYYLWQKSFEKPVAAYREARKNIYECRTWLLLCVVGSPANRKQKKFPIFQGHIKRSAHKYWINDSKVQFNCPQDSDFLSPNHQFNSNSISKSPENLCAFWRFATCVIFFRFQSFDFLKRKMKLSRCKFNFFYVCLFLAGNFFCAVLIVLDYFNGKTLFLVERKKKILQE